jgi:nitroreductase
MDKTIEDIMTRRSVRNFDKRPVSRADLETIVEAALSAPSANGKRPWHVVVIEDAETRKRVTDAMEWFRPVAEAQAAILVCGVPEKSFQGDYWLVDCAALTENALLAARALGLGSVWCGISPLESNVERIRSVLDLPKGLVPFSMIAIGYPEKKDAFRERNRSGDDARVTWNPDWLKR